MCSNKKLALSIFWVVLGTALVILSAAEVLDSSLYAGMGGALACIGVLQIIRNIRYRKDSDYREKIDTEVSDERNQFLRMKSWAYTGYIVVLAQGIGIIIALILGKESIQQILSFSVCLILTVYWITYMVLSRKY